MNPLSILVAALAYWLLGAAWYSALFGGVWSSGLQKQGSKLPEPSAAQLRAKLVLTFVATLVAAIVLAWLISQIGASTCSRGLVVGAAAGLGASAVALGIAYVWEAKPPSVFLVDASYHLLGLSLAGAVLGAWR